MASFLESSAVDPDKTSTLHVRLLGEFRLLYKGEIVPGLEALRLQSLLARLVLHSEAPQARRHLAFTFWPDSSESQALTNLRRELHNLRQALPDPDQFLQVETKTLRWRPEAPYTLDVADFEQAIATADRVRPTESDSNIRNILTAAVELYKGELLPGCYDDWIMPERERLHQKYLAALDQVSEVLQAQGNYRTAIRYAQRLLREDPLSEEGYRRLMQLHP